MTPNTNSHHTVAMTAEARRLFLAWRAARRNAAHATDRYATLSRAVSNGMLIGTDRLTGARERARDAQDVETATHRAYLDATH